MDPAACHVVCRTDKTTLEPMSDKKRIQAEQYDFPYHHLVDMDAARFGRSVGFGLDYYTYMGRVLDLIKKYVNDSVLDIGCGDGFLLCQIGRDPQMQDFSAVGLDLDERAIKFAQAFSHGMQNVEFYARDIANHDQPATLITLVETLEHIPDDVLPGFLHHVDRILTPGGILIVSVPSIARPTLDKHFRHYDLELLQSHFPEYSLLEVHFMTARGSLLYQSISTLMHALPQARASRPIRDILLRTHKRFTADVSEERGAHVIAAFQKPDND